jgi:nitrogen fixation-related uncharacterized protein
MISANKDEERRRTLAVVAFTVAVITVAGFAFVYKMTEFAMTIVKDDIAGFGAVAISIYLIGLVPIIFITLWAICSGKFRDIEAPKHRMLELDVEIERGGELAS